MARPEQQVATSGHGGTVGFCARETKYAAGSCLRQLRSEKKPKKLKPQASTASTSWRTFMTKGKVNAHVSHAAPTETLSGPPGDLPRHLVRRASRGGGVTGLQAAVHLAAPGAGQGGGVLYMRPE